jgi:hypothetical protein
MNIKTKITVALLLKSLGCEATAEHVLREISSLALCDIRKLFNADRCQNSSMNLMTRRLQLFPIEVGEMRPWGLFTIPVW